MIEHQREQDDSDESATHDETNETDNDKMSIEEEPIKSSKQKKSTSSNPQKSVGKEKKKYISSGATHRFKVRFSGPLTIKLTKQ